MYFVNKGHLGLSLGQKFNNFVIVRLNYKYHFGDLLLFTDERCEYDIVVTSSTTELLTLNKLNFNIMRINFNDCMNKIFERSFRLLNIIEARKLRALQYYDKNKDFYGFYYTEMIKVNNNVNLWLEKSFNYDTNKKLGRNIILNQNYNYSHNELISPKKVSNKKLTSRKSIRTKMLDLMNSAVKTKVYINDDYSSDENRKSFNKTNNASKLQSKKQSLEIKVINKVNIAEKEHRKFKSKKSFRSIRSKSSVQSSSKSIFNQYIRKSLKSFKEDSINISKQNLNEKLIYSKIQEIGLKEGKGIDYLRQKTKNTNKNSKIIESIQFPIDKNFFEELKVLNDCIDQIQVKLDKSKEYKIPKIDNIISKKPKVKIILNPRDNIEINKNLTKAKMKRSETNLNSTKSLIKEVITNSKIYSTDPKRIIFDNKTEIQQLNLNENTTRKRLIREIIFKKSKQISKESTFINNNR